MRPQQQDVRVSGAAHNPAGEGVRTAQLNRLLVDDLDSR